VVLTERNVFGAMFERHGKFHLSRAEEILTCVGLWGKRHELAANLSYGQRKLLEIGRALAMNAEIFLFDEPFAGLFPEIARAVSNILMELKKEGKTIVLVEHDIGVVRKISDEVFVLDSGQLLAQGKPDEALARREAVEAYLGD
jgi:branched-chain amino acid transport system ATP-binding protein